MTRADELADQPLDYFRGRLTFRTVTLTVTSWLEPQSTLVPVYSMV